MPDPIITEGGIVAAVASKLLYDVCGESAKYVGGRLAEYTKVGAANLEKVLTKAKELLGDAPPKGSVPPRVMHQVLSEAYFCEDELQASYLGGVLASSRGPISRDDRAVSFCALLAGMSSYQIRTHFIIYSAILRLPEKQMEEFYHIGLDRGHGVTICINEPDYVAAMDFAEGEDAEVIGRHCFLGLASRDLCEGGASTIPPRDKKGQLVEVPKFRFFYPTPQGIELFLWAMGQGHRDLAAFTPNLLKAMEIPIKVRPSGLGGDV